MRNHVLSFLLLFSVIGAGETHTTAESNEVVRLSLERAVFRGTYDQTPDEDSAVDPNDNSFTWQGLLGGTTNGWTLAEKCAAFDWFMETLATNDFSRMSEVECQLARIAVDFCGTISYTNSATSLWGLALNPRGQYRDRAGELAVRFSPVNDQTTRFVETIITNLTGYSLSERGAIGGVFAEKASQLNATYSRDRAINMFYRNRKSSVAAAVMIDEALVKCLPDYRLSSNRLDTALFMLGNAEADDDDRRNFTTITNQLLSSGQPLRWITVGDAP